MFEGKKVVVTGASRDFGVTLSWNFARHGATVYVVCRNLADAQATCALVERHVPHARLRPMQCDLTRPHEIRTMAAAVRTDTQAIDILINNGAMWLQADDFLAASDDDIAATINSGAVGPVLMTKHLLPLLRASGRGDIVNMVSKCGESGYESSPAHEAFYAMKHAHAGFAEILGKRLRHSGIRCITLFPPKFDNTSPFDPAWEAVPRGDHMQRLNARSLVETINFALTQPRSAYISEIRFEDNRIPDMPKE
ncbi:MAG TPA: SDR family oxidoreductase [Burkholderiaceae bacterium]|nr:SDR family oxidoreductase [Burkholderiaceae bacterium]